MEYLYHYTTVDVLKLILTNKTIRFRSLKFMDDLEEKETLDFLSYGRFWYVSSWVKKEEQDTSMWSKYGNRGKGVRIALPTYPFKYYKHPIIDGDIDTQTGKVSNNRATGFYETPIKEELLQANYHIQLMGRNFLKKVIYTSDKDYLYPQIEASNGRLLDHSRIGKYKNPSWSFQEEYRYIFHVSPVGYKEIKTVLNDSKNLINKIKNRDLPFDFYDIELDDKAMDNMKILLGPSIESEKDIVDYINSINPKIKIEENDLKGKVSL